MTERRFNEREVAAIFAQATEEQQADRGQLSPSPRDGMTIADVEEIGREVGIAPELLRQAAKSLDRHDVETSQRLLGFPIGVGRVVDLDRVLSDAEWEAVVADLRQTFDATGRVRQDGAFREWRNGNLRAALEPMQTGHRLRLRTVKTNARAFMLGGLATLGVAAAAGVSIAVGAGGHLTVAKVAQIAIFGVGILSVGAVMVPGWARLRRRQMGELVQRLTRNR
jgi:hypothetical protein